jgi:hypothetical protein
MLSRLIVRLKEPMVTAELRYRLTLSSPRRRVGLGAKKGKGAWRDGVRFERIGSLGEKTGSFKMEWERRAGLRWVDYSSECATYSFFV